MQTAFDFLSTTELRDHFKWRANKNEHRERGIAHLNVGYKSNK